MAEALLADKPEPVLVRSVAELAASGGVREALDWFAAQRKWINEKHLELARIPAPTFQEQKRAAWIMDQFRAMGCDSRQDRAGNVLTCLGPAQDGPLVALTAHLDTVLEPRVPEDISVAPDGRFLGPGVSDNGAGLAALLGIAMAIRSSPILLDEAPPLVLIANVGEEGEGNLSGMRYLCRPSANGPRFHSFVVLDGPSTDHITHRALASRRFEISVSGPGGHSWSDYGIGNPVHAISRGVFLFSEHQEINGDGAPRSSFNFGTIEGGASVNAIPTLARAKVDIRSESPQRLDELAALLSSSMERAIEVENDRATGGRVLAKIREIGSRPGGQLPSGAPILAHLRAVDAHLRIRANLDCSSTDANIPLSLGLQAVSIGAGGQGGGAHTASEWFHPEGRELGLRRILLSLLMLTRDARKTGL